MNHTIRSIIVEDDPRHAESLAELLQLLPVPVEVLDTCTNIDDSVESIAKFKPDLIFLDIDLDYGENGFDLLKRFAKPDFSVIFITQHNTKSNETLAIETCALRFFPKPVKASELLDGLHQYNKNQGIEQVIDLKENIESEESGPVHIYIAGIGGRTRIKVSNILYCESDNYSTHFYLIEPVDGKLHHVSCDSIGSWEQRLLKTKVLRVHNEFLANLQYVEKYIPKPGNTAEVVLSCGNQKKVVNVSRSRRDDTRRRLDL